MNNTINTIITIQSIPLIKIPRNRSDYNNPYKNQKEYGRKLITDIWRLSRIVEFHQKRSTVSYPVKKLILQTYTKLQEKAEKKENEILTEDFKRITETLHELLFLIRDLFHKTIHNDDEGDDIYLSNHLYYKKQIAESWVSEREFESFKP